MFPIQILMTPYWNHWSILLESIWTSAYWLLRGPQAPIITPPTLMPRMALEPQFIRVNFAGCLCIASSKCILGQLLHCRDCLRNHEEHDSWKEGPVMMLGHNASHSLSRHIVSFLFFFFTWLHHQFTDGIATDTSSLSFLPILLFLLLWSLCYNKAPIYILLQHVCSSLALQ